MALGGSGLWTAVCLLLLCAYGHGTDLSMDKSTHLKTDREGSQVKQEEPASISEIPEPHSELVPAVWEKSSAEGESESESESENESESESENEAEGLSPEGEVTSVEEVCVFVSLFSLCMIFILVGNTIVFAIIMKDKTLRRNTSNLFLVSLVAARATIGIFVVPARITGMFSEAYLGSTLCKLCHFAAMGSTAASVFSVVAVAVAKYLSLKQKNKAEIASMKKSGTILGIIWFAGFMYAIRAPVMNDLVYITVPYSGMKMWSCVISEESRSINKYFIILDLICLFVIPYLIIIYCYLAVIKTLAETRGHSEVVYKESKKAIKMLVVLMFLFTVCTIAPIIMDIYVYWFGGFFDEINTVAASVYLFSYSNSWMNLIVFAIFRQDLRDGFWRMWKNRPKCTIKWTCRESEDVSEGLSGTSIELSEETETEIDVESSKSKAGIMMEF